MSPSVSSLEPGELHWESGPGGLLTDAVSGRINTLSLSFFLSLFLSFSLTLSLSLSPSLTLHLHV